MAAIQKSRQDIPAEKLDRLRALMIEAVPDSLVAGHEPLIEGLRLRDPDDRHVLAAAIKVGAQVIVTADKDFTSADLASWGIEAKHPDDFVLDQIDINGWMVWGCVQQIANSRKRHPETVEDVLSQLARSGLVQSAVLARHCWRVLPGGADHADPPDCQ